MINLNFGDNLSDNGLFSLADNSVDCVLTDPPYLYLKNQKLDRPFDEDLFFNECKRVLKDQGFIVLFGRGTSFYRWNYRLSELGFIFKEEVIWDKRQVSSPMNSLSRRHETISIFTKKSGKINKIKIPFIEANRFEPNKILEAIYRITTTFGNRKTFDLLKKYYETGEYEFNEGRERKFNATLQTDIKKTNRTLQFAITMEEGVMERSIIPETRDHYSAIHPTQKPVRLLERLLGLTTKEGDLVVDPFAGSCSAGIACYNTNRNFIGWEIDEEYYDLAAERIGKLQGQQLKIKL